MSAFVTGRDATWESVAPGVRRQILGHGTDLMLVRVEFDRGAVGALHGHPHRQVTYVVSGTFDATVGDVTERLVAGDSFYVTAGVNHGVVAIEAGTLVDVFTPPRLDFLGGI